MNTLHLKIHCKVCLLCWDILPGDTKNSSTNEHKQATLGAEIFAGGKFREKKKRRN